MKGRAIRLYCIYSANAHDKALASDQGQISGPEALKVLGAVFKKSNSNY